MLEGKGRKGKCTWCKVVWKGKASLGKYTVKQFQIIVEGYLEESEGKKLKSLNDPIKLASSKAE